MSNPARRRFFAARAAIAKRQDASPATITPPAGRFAMRIVGVRGSTSSETLDDGTIAIRNARLFHGDAEIDGATVIVHDDIVEDVRTHLQFCEIDVEGEAVVSDEGYVLVTYDQPDLRMAA